MFGMGRDREKERGILCPWPANCLRSASLEAGSLATLRARES